MMIVLTIGSKYNSLFLFEYDNYSVRQSLTARCLNIAVIHEF